MKNVYTDYIQDKGFTVGECQRSAEDREYPKTIHGRTFETREQYLAELHDFLNGMWHPARCTPFPPKHPTGCHTIRVKAIRSKWLTSSVLTLVKIGP